MLTLTGRYTFDGLTETGEYVFDSLTETGRYVVPDENSALYELLMSGGAVIGGSIAVVPFSALAMSGGSVTGDIADNAGLFFIFSQYHDSDPFDYCVAGSEIETDMFRGCIGIKIGFVVVCKFCNSRCDFAVDDSGKRFNSDNVFRCQSPSFYQSIEIGEDTKELSAW